MNRLRNFRLKRALPLVLAVVFHLAFLAIQIKPSQLESSEHTVVLSIELLPEQETTNEEQLDTKEERVEEITQDQKKTEKAVETEEIVQETLEEQAPEPSNETPQELSAQLLLSGDSFKSWLKVESERSASSNPQAMATFKQSFEPKIVEKKPDIVSEVPMLEGGIYKIRKNGVTCNALTMLPITMDDHLYGTISTSGDCREDEKIKIVLD